MTSSRPTIVCTAPLTVRRVERLLAPDADAEVIVLEDRSEAGAQAAVAEADIVIGDYSFEVPITRSVIEAMTRCRLIQQPSVGYQQIDAAAAAERGIPVANTAGANDAAVAEHTVMLALALLKHLVFCDSEVREGRWPQNELLDRGHYELAGRTWGLVGAGRTGRETARRLAAWDVRLVYTDVIRLDAHTEQELGLDYLDQDELLAAADIVSLHVPLTADTERMINADRLAQMKDTALLINVARGEVVDTDALVDALRDGAIAGAALDVADPEPLPAGHLLAELDNVVLTPHVAGTTMDARRRIMDLAGENIRRVMAGEPPVAVVNGVL